MKLHTAFFLLTVIFAEQSEARLGESVKACSKLYANWTQSAVPGMYFGTLGDLSVTAKFRGDACQSIAYIHSVRARGLPPMQISEKQRGSLIKQNFRNQSFTTKTAPGEMITYISSDKRRIGTYDLVRAELVVTQN